MTSAFAQKKLRVYDAQPVGAVCQSPINLETMTQGQWIALDGRDCIRNAYPEVQAMFPTGTFTTTSRTLGATSVASTITADSVNFVCPGAAGTQPIQASPDGANWTVAPATWTAATQLNCVEFCGTRLYAVGTGGDFATGFWAITAGLTATATVTKANWTQITGGSTTSLTTSITYSPTYGLTTIIPSGAGTTIYTIADGATTAVARTTTSADKKCVCWTGKNVLCFLNISNNNWFHTSGDGGATWTDAYANVLFGGTGAQSCASDGNGTVVVLPLATNTNRLALSKDHGATWRYIYLPTEVVVQTTGQGLVKYLNGRFVMYQSNGWAFSSDGANWTYEPIGLRGVSVMVPGIAIAYKTGTWCGVLTTATGNTAVEDFSKFRLPYRISSTTVVPSDYPYYIKVRSS